MERKIRVTVWNEYRHEKSEPSIREIYPDGIHGCVGNFLTEADFEVTLATLDDPNQGLPDEILNVPTCFFGGDICHIVRYRMSLLKK